MKLAKKTPQDLIIWLSVAAWFIGIGYLAIKFGK
jgi:hypothetical protein